MGVNGCPTPFCVGVSHILPYPPSIIYRFTAIKTVQNGKVSESTFHDLHFERLQTILGQIPWKLCLKEEIFHFVPTTGSDHW